MRRLPSMHCLWLPMQSHQLPWALPSRLPASMTGSFKILPILWWPCQRVYIFNAKCPRSLSTRLGCQYVCSDFLSHSWDPWRSRNDAVVCMTSTVATNLFSSLDRSLAKNWGQDIAFYDSVTWIPNLANHAMLPGCQIMPRPWQDRWHQRLTNDMRQALSPASWQRCRCCF